MGIRKHNKDHQRELGPSLVKVSKPLLAGDTDDILRFWTKNKHPSLVMLHIFASGDDCVSPKYRAPEAGRGFSGRPTLINELAPALRELLEYAAPATINIYLQSLRDWWRLLDSVELPTSQGIIPLEPVRSVADFAELHHHRALDVGMDSQSFSATLLAINIIRKIKGLRRLHWRGPSRKARSRKLPPQWQTRIVRITLKHAWFSTLDRWERASALLEGGVPFNEEEKRLLKNYQKFRSVSKENQHPRPSAEAFYDGKSATTFNRQGFSIPEMLKGFYPNAEDIRIAFHLCLASTGWNPAVFLSLDANSPFIEPHPKDPTRYLLWGYKARARSQQMSEGLYKTQGSAGVILMTLLERTAPLRAQLRRDLKKEESIYSAMLMAKANTVELDAQRKRVEKLREGVSSVWLYVTSVKSQICWFNGSSYSCFGPKERNISFLDQLINQINSRQPADLKIALMKPSDFRDAYAAYAYQISGGMMLYVMKALGHRSIRSTEAYTNNTLLNSEANWQYLTFSNRMWHEIRVSKRLDLTVLAKHSRDGNISDEERERLATYRNLRRSRIDVGCRDPKNPPKRIAPRFQANGKDHCHVQRCMLCVENAVLFPDSIRGICKRLAELRHIQSRMSTQAFIESSFDEEIENIKLALAAFNQHEVTEHVADWESRIRDGRHRIVDIDGLQRI